MFEQAFVQSAGGGSRPWTVAVSLAGQMALVALMILVPLMQSGVIVPGHLVNILTAPPPPLAPQVAEVAPNTTRARSASAVRPTFDLVLRQPARVPDRILISDDAPPQAFTSDNAPPGVPGGMPGTGGTALVEMPVIVAPPPREAKPAPLARVRVGGVVQAGKLLRQVAPLYPEIAKQARISGQVRLEAVISKDGRIENLQVVSGHPMLVRAALEAVQRWIYRPTILNDEPVEVMTVIDVNFTLR